MVMIDELREVQENIRLLEAWGFDYAKIANMETEKGILRLIYLLQHYAAVPSELKKVEGL